MLDIYWLLCVCIRTIEHADNTGSLFAFTSEFYLNVAMNAYSALKNYFSPANGNGRAARLRGNSDSARRHPREALCRSTHRWDRYQRLSDAGAGQLRLLPTIPQGCGEDPGGAASGHDEEPAGSVRAETLGPDQLDPGQTVEEPCPSLLLQRHMAELLSMDKDMAASFLNSVLNQLNWAFSEFIGMIQEIQQAAERPERNFVDTRQLKVCATCFDLSVSLLRVLEMTVTLVPEIFLDWSRPSAELLLRRLAQLLNQVLNRVTAEKNLFDRVVNLRLPGLESVDHYPILVAVTGILVRILVDGDRQGVSRAASVLLSDPCFQLHSIQHLLGEGGESSSSSAAVAPSVRPAMGSLGSSVATPLPSAAGNSGSSERKHFSLHAYTDYISEEEKHRVELMLAFLTEESKQAAASTAVSTPAPVTPASTPM
ncbi:E3 ubiquitin-protein ligase RNF123-like isoform X1 [Simochromis diagramma]|uniref:E3 ubiquitin-protein ligase RNF123-like isoform X1 n=1 Tax=Simochromis diagramma TaxID=43689 RepID=UPI001A7E2A05|nr:E3 ubiquitin-protein ligase RNF123-like isoform X1 [Simochromis diagramma]